MVDAHYVCAGCLQPDVESVSCSSCGGFDFLDIRIPSERDLLEDLQAQRKRGRFVVPLLMLFMVVPPALVMGMSWLGQHWLELSELTAQNLAMSILCASFLGVMFFLTVFGGRASPDEQETTQDMGTWEAQGEPMPSVETDDTKLRNVAQQQQLHKH